MDEVAADKRQHRGEESAQPGADESAYAEPRGGADAQAFATRPDRAGECAAARPAVPHPSMLRRRAAPFTTSPLAVVDLPAPNGARKPNR